jgi:hypothetical protein
MNEDSPLLRRWVAGVPGLQIDLKFGVQQRHESADLRYAN